MARGVTGILGLILLAASVLFALFIILAGVTDNAPLDRTYFLEADTSGISGARDLTRWTFFHFCGDDNQDCSRARPAPAFGKAWESNALNAPEELIGGHGDDTTSSYYFYMWRFGWVWFILALVSSAIAFFAGFLACCGRIGAFISSIVSFFAMIFWTLAAVFMTVVFAKARNAFEDDNREARIGPYAYGFAWAGWACTFMATSLFCSNTRKSKDCASNPPRHRDAPPRRKFGFLPFGRRGGGRVKGDYA